MRNQPSRLNLFLRVNFRGLPRIAATSSPSKLASVVADVFPDSIHVREAALERADDDQIWRFALEHGLAIVTKDSDFQARGQIVTTAARIVWIRRGNCPTAEIEAPLRQHAARITALSEDGIPGFLMPL